MIWRTGPKLRRNLSINILVEYNFVINKREHDGTRRIALVYGYLSLKFRKKIRTYVSQHGFNLVWTASNEVDFSIFNFLNWLQLIQLNSLILSPLLLIIIYIYRKSLWFFSWFRKFVSVDVRWFQILYNLTRLFYILYYINSTIIGFM